VRKNKYLVNDRLTVKGKYLYDEKQSKDYQDTEVRMPRIQDVGEDRIWEEKPAIEEQKARCFLQSVLCVRLQFLCVCLLLKLQQLEVICQRQAVLLISFHRCCYNFYCCILSVF
jgi:hypothetical protein